MFINNFDPVAFQIMSFEIRWYSLAYILGIVIGWILCKKIFIKKSDISEKFDDYITYLIIGVIIGGRIGYIVFYNFSYYLDNFFGRLANFINSELYGTVSDVPWSVIFIKVDNLSRHPSQLYEAILEGLILFIILIYFTNKNYLNKPGLISGLFLIFYSIFRFFIEFFRVPDEQIGYLILSLTMGQIISLVFASIGMAIFYLKNENK